MILINYLKKTIQLCHLGSTTVGCSNREIQFTQHLVMPS